jgi:hypothetical protein
MEHNKNRPTAGNMGLKRHGLNVMWFGKPSMRWSSIVPVVQSMINCFGFPKAVICHCGGNEIDCLSTLGKIFEKTILLPGHILLIVYNEHIN